MIHDHYQYFHVIISITAIITAIMTPYDIRHCQ